MKISIIGAGAMGGAIAHGLLKSGFPASDLSISNPSEEKLKPFEGSGCSTTIHNWQVCNEADLIIIAVKPWILPNVIREITPFIDYAHQAVSVVAAGVTGEKLIEWFSKVDHTCPKISLSMPNTAVRELQSMTFIVPVSGDEKNPDVDLFCRLGEVSVIEEKLLRGATALASCGIAYALRYIHAATEGGVELGFRASEAQRIVAQTVKGAAALLADGAHAEAEIDKVTTPGGLTIRGLNAMEKAGFTPAVLAGLKI